ncbi:MAG: serine/threonine protein kinase [Polyangiaceae bacterium]|nr:serine/threonine protein kinase [Polyangiaceae bacterium]
MSDQNPDSLPPETVRAGTVIGHYRVVRRLGVGGMGEVYLVQHTGTDEMFAMKVLLSQTISDASALDRFRREARTPARIESDHVVRVTHVDVSEELKGAPYLVMEYLRGEDLDQQLLQSGPMQPRDVVTYLQQVARVLDKAHAKGIVHRDLKPENIFITRREDGTPHVKILDFGIAKYTAGAGDMVSKTATSPGQIYGTPLYMAPEQAKGESKKISPQTDIWALGLIANRMLSAKDYWDAETLTALIAQVVYEPMQKPSARSSDFAFGAKYDAWFMQCCNRDIDSRFATAGEAVFKLGQALDVIDPDAAYAPGRPSSLMAAPPPSLRVAESRPLSKTELQLAQTGISGPPKSEKGTLLKVAGGAAAAALLVGAVLFATKKPGDAHGSRPSAVEDTSSATRRTPAKVGAVTASTGALVTPATSSPTASATASSASAEPTASASAEPTPSSTVEPRAGTGKPVRPKTSGAPTATVGPTAPPPPPPPATQDPLKDRL